MPKNAKTGGDAAPIVLPCRMCEKPFLFDKTKPLPKSFPFCSRRCKMADLDNWLNERYSFQTDLTDPNDPHADSYEGGADGSGETVKDSQNRDERDGGGDDR